MAAHIALVFFATMVIAALLKDLLFTGLDWVPMARPARPRHCGARGAGP